MADINLLQGANKRPNQSASAIMNSTMQRSGSGLLIFLVAIVLLEALAYGGLWYYRKSTEQKIQDTENAIVEIDAQLSSQQQEIDEAIAAQARIQSFEKLLDSHVHWSQVWDELAAKTLTVARFVSLEADKELNQFKVNGEVASFSDLGKLLLGLEQSEHFIDVSFTSASINETGAVSFDVVVTFDPKILVVENNT